MIAAYQDYFAASLSAYLLQPLFGAGVQTTGTGLQKIHPLSVVQKAIDDRGHFERSAERLQDSNVNRAPK